MKSGLTIREDNYSSVLDALKQLSGTDVLVGIPAGPPREDSPLSNAEIGYLQSTGATVEIDGDIVTLPPRPFLDMGIEDSRDKTTARLKLAAQAALEGNAGLAEQHLEAAGQIARDASKAVIGDGDRLTPLSEKTLQRRRAQGLPGDKPLYAHGFLLRAINYVVRKK
ncbi:TPA: hypothetical protein ACYVCC_003185 [Klebsiella pneumoniae]|uniref:hypothetical protein n=1 Tax=Klebsiella pneumoniae TaxID=573 RepID=UPI0013D14C84|nr:hypothetical protein [Klebsiella pneumoniae]HBX3870683.1 hypothetical protein [Klebsiella pneumoniae subsp. pneumoniae]ELB5207632.1 hypothetical protein [Klebsiella pneumoniae]MEA4708455.1 hypothetical protein [Klebsiella pneumoniae]NGG85899.1 hypothetical protein [Klebsiella pneumoniae]HBQ0511181.1 hypothetical protein [Klebsiella pneumoniae]